RAQLLSRRRAVMVRPPGALRVAIGRASCRERGQSAGVAGPFQKNSIPLESEGTCGGAPRPAGGAGGRGRARREGGGGVGGARGEFTALIVGGEDNEAAAVTHGETHGHGSPGVQEHAIERRRCAEDPVTRARAAGAPDAGGHGPVAVESQGGDGTAAGGAQS